MSKTFLLISFTCLLLSSCTNKKQFASKKIFRYNESKGIASLDPAFARNQSVMWPINQLFNGLVQIDDSLNVKPCIAKRWKISDGNKKYTFYLRQDVYFHNQNIFPGNKGRKVIAVDFEYSFNRLIDPTTASPGAWIFNIINKNKKGTNNGFKAENDSVFEIYLKNPFPAFLGLLTMQYCSVVPKEAIKNYGNDFRNHPVGTGPFKFKKWIEGEKLVLVKNENYFEKDKQGKSLPYIDAVAITFIADKQSEFLEFIKGKIDFIHDFNSSFKDELITRHGKLNPKYYGKIKLLVSPYLNTEYLGILIDTSLNIVRKSPLRFREVRQAINLGFDRVKMMDYLRNNIGYPATSGILPMGMPSFSDKEVPGYVYNPDSAAKLLTKAGFPGGKRLDEITLTTTSDYLDLCEFIQQQLSQLGIRLKIEVATGATFRDMMANSKLIFFRNSWIADYPDAENYLALFYSKNFSPNGPNYSHFKSKEYDRLYERSMNEPNDNIRYNYYRQMQRLLIAESVIIPLYYDVAVRFINNRVNNLGINSLNLLKLKQVIINN
jgi:peptide/nickel transport system substrate-binding protein